MTDQSDDRLALLAAAAETLGGELALDRVLERTVQVAAQVTGARYGALGVVDGEGRIGRFVSTGVPPEVVGRINPAGRGLLGLLIRDPRVLRLTDLRTHPASVGFPPHHPAMTSFLGTPIRSGGQVYGNLYLTEKPGGFTAADERVVMVLAAQAGSAIQNASLAERLQALAIEDERDRIFQELHDGVIQSLFSIGLALSSARELAHSDPDRVIDRIEAAIEDLDDTLRRLRNAIFHLRPERAAELGMTRGLGEIVREHEVNALERPDLSIQEGLDEAVPEGLAEGVLRAARTALALRAKQNPIGEVVLRARTVDDRFELSVTGDGDGPAIAQAPGPWLAGLQHLVEGQDGTLETWEAQGGTSLTISVPLPVASANGIRLVT
jgi:signal transduction histidine kinase